MQARYSEAVEAYGQMRAAAEALQATPAQARAWNEIALVQSSQGDNRACFESTQRAEMLARAAGAPAPRRGWSWRARSTYRVRSARGSATRARR